MKTIIRRLRMLEERFGPQVKEESQRLVALLEARRKRWAEAEGKPYEPLPRGNFPGRTIVEILRSGLEQRRRGETENRRFEDPRLDSNPIPKQ